MNVLYTSVCNDRYANALTLLLWSIKHHNPDFNFPFKVYHKGDLSAPSQERIRSVYPEACFDDVSKSGYSTKICHYLALETFRETEPDIVVFIDSDIICTGDISHLSTLDHPISAALDYDFRVAMEFDTGRLLAPIARLNTGVFALNKTYRSSGIYDALYAMLDTFPDKRVKGMAWSDQGIINRYFRKDSKHILPYQYNARKNLFSNSKFKSGPEAALKGVRLLHFGGTCKPFLGGLRNAAPTSKHHKYSSLHEVYYDYWARMIKALDVDWPLEPAA